MVLSSCQSFLSIIQMIMEQSSNSIPRTILLRLFLRNNATPPYLLTVQTCFQAVLYVAVIYGFPLGTALFAPSSANISISLILMGLLMGRLSGGLSLVKFVYVPIVSYCLTVRDSASIVFLTIIGLLLLADVLSSISFDFYSQNLASESLNQCKLLHFTAIIFGLCQTIIGKGFITDGICSGLFLGIWLYKRSSICRSRPFKELQLMLYLWFAASHLMVMTSNWLSLPLLLQLGIPLGFTQTVLRWYLSKRGSNSLDQLYSQQNYLKMAFELMIYLHGETFSSTMDKQIEAFLADPMYPSLREADRRKLVHQKLIEILARRNAYEEQLISCQIFLFYNHQLLKAKGLLVRLQQGVGWGSWMKKICLFRVEETLRDVYLHKNQEIHFANYQQYYRCDQFRSMLLRSSIAFIAFWEYTRRPEIISSRLRELADRLVRLQRTLNKQFSEIQPKCLTISLLQVSYLLEVARDSNQANDILQRLAFNQDFEINLQIDEKLFLQVSLQGEGMVFERVGHNSSLLIGFQRKQLQGQKIDLLLPQFYRKFHSKYVTQCFQKEFQRLYLYCKKSIVRNKWAYYEQCNIMLRLHFNEEGDLVLRGYLQVKPNHDYSWTHFLFITDSEEIVECSQSFVDYNPTASRLHRAGEIFENLRLYKPIVQKTAQTLIQYHPLLVFQTDIQKVIYYVRMMNQGEDGQNTEGKEREGVMQLLQTMQLRKFQWQFVKSYYLRAQQVLKKVYSKEYLLLAIVALLCIGGLLACQAFFFNSAINQSKSEQSTMETTRQVLLYYDSSIALGMRIAYVGIKTNYNYTNNISSNNLLSLALVLQTNNQKLKGFTKNKYALPSLLPNVTYQKPNYDMIVQLLSNAYLIQQFLDDLFVVGTVLPRAQLSLNAIFGSSLGEYQANFVQSVKDLDQNIGQSLAISSIIALLVLICVIVVRVQHRLRRDEQQTLSLIASVHQQEELITTTRQFISKITREDTALIRYESDPKAKGTLFNTSFAPDNTNREKDGPASRSQMSLREISGRDLLGDSFNRSGVLQTVVTSRLQPAPMQSFAIQSQQIQVTPPKRWLLGVALGLSVTIGAISIANEVKFNINGQIDLHSSVSSIFTFLSTGTVFSRSMIMFLNMLALRYNGPIDTTPFDTYMTTYSKTQTFVTFPEGSFSEFEPFQSALNEISFQYMCTYVTCDPNFANEVDIIYTTTIQKVITQVLTLKGRLNTMNASILGVEVRNGSLNRLIDLIYYSQLTIKTQLQRVLYLYVSCFGDYSNNLKLKKQIMMAAAITVTLFALIALILLIVYVVKHQGLLRDIAGLLKTDSYINQDNQILDKEAARPSSELQK